MRNVKEVLTVSEFVNVLKGVIHNYPSFKNVALVGELSNFKAHNSGHFYFSLKDKTSRIAVVMFKTSASKVLFTPKDGDKVIVRGRLDVFDASGQVQIYADALNLDGLGDLHIQFERLKKEYEHKGYFDAAHKRAIPSYPQSIAIITGANSAAYHDIKRTLSERWPLALQHDLLAYVQGEYAVNSLVEQIKHAHQLKCDVIILARGGGSIEDLWAFNEVPVVEAVYEATIPIISGVGHESDTTLVDFVADYRAATPTAAAVRATPDQNELSQTLRHYKNRTYQSVRNRLLKRKHQHQQVLKSRFFANPMAYIHRKQQLLDYQQSRIVHQLHMFETIKQRLERFTNQSQARLHMRIHNQHARITMQQDTLQKDTINNINKKQETLETMSGLRHQQLLQLYRSLKQQERDLKNHEHALIRRMERSLNLNTKRFIDIIKVLNKQSPLEKMAAIYKQGFAHVSIRSKPVMSVQNVAVDDTITIAFQDGEVIGKIIEKSEEFHNE